MNGRRIVYILALAAALIFSALYPFWFSWYLAVLVTLIMPFDIIITLPALIKLRIALSAPQMLEQDSSGVLTVKTVRGLGVHFPARSIKMRLDVSFDDRAISRSFVLGAADGDIYEIEIDTSGSGGLFFHTKRIWLISLIGLFAFPKKSDCSAGTLILPSPIEPRNAIALPRSTALRPKPGGGYAENHELRQYRPGDPVKTIHWKASVKLDTLYVREPLVAPLHTRLLKVDRWRNSHERDIILARLRWVSNYLLSRELTYFVKLSNIAAVAEIRRPEELIDYLFFALVKGINANNTIYQQASTRGRFDWVLCIDAKENVVDSVPQVNKE